MCTQCSEKLGHCPMRFYNGSLRNLEKLDDSMDVCLCHNDYNHCVASNENGEIPDIVPSSDLDKLNFAESFVLSASSESSRGKFAGTTTTTTQEPEVAQAMGYEVGGRDGQ